MIVYTTNNCQACRMTKLHLTNLGIAYTEPNEELNKLLNEIKWEVETV